MNSTSQHHYCSSPATVRLVQEEVELQRYHEKLNRRSLLCLAIATACYAGAAICAVRLIINLFMP